MPYKIRNKPLIIILMIMVLSLIITINIYQNEEPPFVKTVEIISDVPTPIMIEELDTDGMPTGNGERQYTRGDILVILKGDSLWSSPNDWLPYGNYIKKTTYSDNTTSEISFEVRDGTYYYL